MKYALVCPADQTIAFLQILDDESSEERKTRLVLEEPYYTITTKHPEAFLFDSLEEATAYKASLGDDGWWTEAVPDEAEFRSREDTW